MKAIYPDHNIIQYFSGCFPNSVDAAAEFAALEAAKSDPDFHFVFSPWSIFEAASGTDLKRVEACANFIEDLSLCFIPDHPVLAKQEMRRYVFRKYFSEDTLLEPPFTACYSQHLAELTGSASHLPMPPRKKDGIISAYNSLLILYRS